MITLHRSSDESRGSFKRCSNCGKNRSDESSEPSTRTQLSSLLSRSHRSLSSSVDVMPFSCKLFSMSVLSSGMNVTARILPRYAPRIVFDDESSFAQNTPLPLIPTRARLGDCITMTHGIQLRLTYLSNSQASLSVMPSVTK